jgi:hypothetical protein
MGMECEVVMCVTQDAKTVAVKACFNCSGGLLEYDKFCRWCGERQPELRQPEVCEPELRESELWEVRLTKAAREFDEAKSAYAAKSTGSSSSSRFLYATSELERVVERSGIYRRVSGPLVSAVVSGVSANSPQVSNRFTQRAVFALISIPIWLIIVLLSPFDAYAAAKNLSREN